MGRDGDFLPDVGLKVCQVDAPEGCQSLTMLAAIHFAFDKLKATAVDLYGADLEGTADFDGEQDDRGRTPERWEWEAKGLEVLRAKYGKRKIKRIEG